MDHVYFEQGAEVGDACGGDEDVADLAGCDFFFFVFGAWEGESGWGKEFLDGDIEGVDFAFVGESEAVYEGFRTYARDLDEVGERGLGVCVAEGVA